MPPAETAWASVECPTVPEEPAVTSSPRFAAALALLLLVLPLGAGCGTKAKKKGGALTIAQRLERAEKESTPDQ